MRGQGSGFRAAYVRAGAGALLAILNAAGAGAQDGLEGFSAAGAEAERALEARFDATLDPDNLRDWMRRLSAEPHHVGSAYDKANAEFIAGQFRAWGYDTEIETFYVLFPTPKTRRLEMVSPDRFTAGLEEPALDEDATSGQKDSQLPTYNAYSPDGDVTAEVVYVNYGIPEDYEVLERLGIDVAGKIVIARYGNSWRGIKPKVAAEHGAVATILYSDPRDDGYFQGDVYPEGPFRMAQGAQRGSVLDAPVRAGDPLTPGIGAKRDVERLSRDEAETMPKIPVLPISYADAEPILAALGGPVAPEEWRGALPLTYHVGPGPARVHLEVAFNWDIEPIYNVIAKLDGREAPDQWVIRGNHHDAWVNGAADPVSGAVALMEEARAVGELAKSGWRPRRTIVYALWDGEEPMLLGSTEWAEQHAALLGQRAVAYINSDGNGRGFLRAGGSHSLERLVNEAARDVTDPQKNIPVTERLRAFRLVEGSKQEREAAKDGILRIGALGSGSDYTPFLQHLGIASLNFGYGGENRGGSYHSIYDSFDHYTRFNDPGFQYGVALAKTAGRVVLRLANAERLPFDFRGLHATLARYVDEVKSLASDMRAETERENALIREGRYAAWHDPTKPFVMPAVEDPVPYLGFAPLENALVRLEAAAKSYQAAAEAHDQSGEILPPEVGARLDSLIYGAERAFLTAGGLPRRPWYRHMIYAPGFYTGYGVKTLPGVREAIEERMWDEAETEIGRTAAAVEAYAAEIDKARRLLAPEG